VQLLLRITCGSNGCGTDFLHRKTRDYQIYVNNSKYAYICQPRFNIMAGNIQNFTGLKGYVVEIQFIRTFA
jgi:hypothetical protein